MVSSGRNHDTSVSGADWPVSGTGDMEALKGSRVGTRAPSWWRKTVSAAVMKTCVVLALLLTAGSSLGGVQKRITAGRPCSPDESRQFVFLETDGICSGSIIGDGSWVLTAKHCDKFKKPFTIKGDGWTETSDSTFKNPNSDLMLIKMKVKKTSAMELADSSDCTNIKNQLDSGEAVEMVLVGRDTDAKNQNKGEKVLCGDIDVQLCHQRPTIGWCFTGTVENCQTCEGDSGGGLIHKAGNQYKVYGVYWGVLHPVDPTSTDPDYPSAAVVCRSKIRKWIHETMDQNP